MSNLRCPACQGVKALIEAHKKLDGLGKLHKILCRKHRELLLQFIRDKIEKNLDESGGWSK